MLQFLVQQGFSAVGVSPAESLVIHSRRQARTGDLAVLVHGVGGNRYAAWGNTPRFLFEDFETLAIGLFQYTSGWRRLGRRLSAALPLVATELADTLRFLPYDRIVLLGHSLGGLIAAAAIRDLINSDARTREGEAAVSKIAGLLLLGTPQTGSKVADWFGWTQDGRHLSSNSPFVTEIARCFADRVQTYGAVVRDDRRVFIPTFALIGSEDALVSPLSSSFALPSANRRTIRSTHGELSKPISRESDSYSFMLDVLTQCMAQKQRDQSTLEPNTFARIPAEAPFFGRQAEQDQVIEALVASSEAILIGGTAGIGKSRLAIQVLHNEVIKAEFGPGRFFVRCDGIRNLEALQRATLVSCGCPVPLTVSPSPSAWAALRGCLVVLDNFEDPWEEDKNAVEEMLSHLLQAGVHIIVTLRGDLPPDGVAWDLQLSLRPLGPDASNEVFFAVAGDRFRSDPLRGIIQELDGLPLALRLLAYQARSESSLAGLYTRWRVGGAERLNVLRNAETSSREDSLSESLRLFTHSTAFTARQRRLAEVVSVLPNGLNIRDASSVLGETSEDVARLVMQSALVFEEDGRVRMLAPFRNLSPILFPVRPEAETAVCRVFLRLGRDLGPKIGKRSGQFAMGRLAAEARNIQEAIALAVRLGLTSEAVETAAAMANAVRLRGLASIEIYTVALSALSEEDIAAKSLLLLELGRIKLARNRDAEGRSDVRDALDLAVQAADEDLILRCREALGTSLLYPGSFEDARTTYTAMLDELEARGDPGKLARAYGRLGEVHYHLGDFEAAQKALERALQLVENLDEPLTSATFHKVLAEIHLHYSRPQEALSELNEALALGEQSGDVLGVANCLLLSVKARFLQGEATDRGRSIIKTARAMYRSIDRPLNVAFCDRIDGWLLASMGRFDEAGASLRSAEATYMRLGYVSDAGACLYDLAESRRREAKETVLSLTAADGLVGESGLELYVAAASRLEQKPSAINAVTLGHCYSRMAQDTTNDAAALEYWNRAAGAFRRGARPDLASRVPRQIR